MSCGTLVSACSLLFSLTRLLLSLAALSNALQLRFKMRYADPQPQKACSLVWALPISLAATFGIDVSFFSSGYLDVSVPRVPSAQTMYSSVSNWSSTSWVSPFGYHGIYACLRLPHAFRSLPRPSSALGALASALCSCSLDFLENDLSIIVDPETNCLISSGKLLPNLATGLQRLFLVFLSNVRLSMCVRSSLRFRDEP